MKKDYNLWLIGLAAATNTLLAVQNLSYAGTQTARPVAN